MKGGIDINNKYKCKRIVVFGIILTFFVASFGQANSGISLKTNLKIIEEEGGLNETSLMTFYTFDKTGSKKHNIELPYEITLEISELIEDLRIKIVNEPYSDETSLLKSDFIDLLDANCLIPNNMCKEDVSSLLNPSWFGILKNNPGLRSKNLFLNSFSDVFSRVGFLSRFLFDSYVFDLFDYLNGANGFSAGLFFCSLGSAGNGIPIPLFLLPRPRVFMLWAGSDLSATNAGSLITGKGFIAGGSQAGVALGFIGIGLTYSLLGVTYYGFIGYSLFTFVNAFGGEWYYPPNAEPVISDENPVNGEKDVPTSLNELSFRISDADGDRMSYSVTTSPNIGSGSGNYKKDGVYSISVSNLESDTLYTWSVEISDGKEVTKKDFNFYTEMLPFDPYDKGWQYRKKITVNHDLVEGDLVNFPVLVSVTDSDLKNKAQVDGDDILFMDGSGVANKMFHEIEFYDDASGALVCWVRLPVLSGDVDNVFYMYYGNPSSGNQQFPEDVWDKDFCAVWHLDDSKDSTINKNNGHVSGSSTNFKPGSSGLGLEILKSGMVQSIPSSFDNSISTEHTINCWVNWYGKDPSYPSPSYVFDARDDNYDGGCILLISEDGTVQFLQLIGSTFIRLRSASTISKNIWTHISVVFDYGSQKLRIFINGVENNATLITSQYLDTDLNPVIGNNRWGPIDGQYRPLNGIIDELRISKTVRSFDWILTDYNNQNDPLSFMVFGPEESSP